MKIANWWCCQATRLNNNSNWWCCHATPATPDNYRAADYYSFKLKSILCRNPILCQNSGHPLGDFKAIPAAHRVHLQRISVGKTCLMSHTLLIDCS